jgi:hypothetical protein
VFVFPITHSSLASMSSSTESRYWPSYVLNKIKSLWSVGGSNAGLNQLAASAAGMPSSAILLSSFVFVTCLLCETPALMGKYLGGGGGAQLTYFYFTLVIRVRAWFPVRLVRLLANNFAATQ